MPARHTPLALWHLLSLDAPTVAALWTWFLARSVGLALPWTAPATMFIAVWMIYAADRLLDARLLDARSIPSPPLLSQTLLSHPLNKTPNLAPDLEERHRFHHRHRTGFLIAVLLAAVALVLLLPRLYPRALALYTLLATLLATWMLLIHALPQPSQGSRRLPKEIAVGLFFPAACFIPTIARAPTLQLPLLPAAVLFAAVCSLNCLFLYAWEHPASPPDPQPPAPPPPAHWTTLWAIRHLPHLGLALLALCLLAATHSRLLAAPALACALSTALLLALHALRQRITAVHLRAAADLVLLSPLLWLCLGQIR